MLDWQNQGNDGILPKTDGVNDQALAYPGPFNRLYCLRRLQEEDMVAESRSD